LRRLEKKYEKELVVIGVHSAKFPNEKDSDNLQNAVRRYQLEHPVINDGHFQVWQQYSCRAWPTLMFIDPQGNVIGKHEGEMSFEQFDNLMEQMIFEFDAKGILKHEIFPSSFQKPETTTLSFPGKVVADENFDRLFIADTNHNRIIITSLNGNLQQIIGSGEEGFTDGYLAASAFNHPQGLSLVKKYPLCG
jgi:hypothetical protein